MSEERGTLAECWVGRLVGCNTTSHLTGPVGGCKAHSVANLPSLAPGCGSSLVKSSLQMMQNNFLFPAQNTKIHSTVCYMSAEASIADVSTVATTRTFQTEVG